MVDISAWMDLFIGALSETFGARVWFVGLQGSYGRGEATAGSDIDVVVILDEASAADIGRYRAMLERLPHHELICGFFAGKGELLSWEVSDLFQFYYDTRPIKGSLDALLPLLDRKAVDRAIKIGACNIYHGCVHNMLHERSGEILQGLYKAASFVLQAIAFRQTGRYVSHQQDLLPIVSEAEQGIVTTFLRYKNGETVDFAASSEALLAFAQRWIKE